MTRFAKNIPTDFQTAKQEQEALYKESHRLGQAVQALIETAIKHESFNEAFYSNYTPLKKQYDEAVTKYGEYCNSFIGKFMDKSAQVKVNLKSLKASVEGDSERGFIANVHGKNGNVIHRTRMHPTREEAMREAFNARPNAKRCSTEKAFKGSGASSDIRSHNRYEMG